MPKKTLSRAARDAVLGMRVQQWLKNLLIFVPAATAHRVLLPDVFPRVFLAFFSFSLCASSGYLINDLFDLKADRGHPVKRNRPFASGALTPRFGVILAVLLFLTAAGFGNLVSPRYDFMCVDSLFNGQHVAATLDEAIKMGFEAGVDVRDHDLGDNFAATLASLVRKGYIPEKVLDEAVRRTLRAKFRLGLFNDPY